MYFTHLLAVFLFFGIDRALSIETLSPEDNALDVPVSYDLKSFAFRRNGGINSRQFSELEKTLNSVYRRFFGPPPRRLTLRRNNDKETSLSSTVTIIGDKICEGIRKMFKSLGGSMIFKERPYGLKTSNNPLEFSILYQLIRMPLEIEPIYQALQNQVKNYLEKNNYVNMGYRKASYSFNNDDDNSTKQWNSLAISDFTKTVSIELDNCLQKNDPNLFDLKRALGELGNLEPKLVGETIRLRLQEPVAKHPENRESEYDELHAFVCHAVAGYSQRKYFDCLVEIKRVDECVHEKLDDSSSRGDRDSEGDSSQRFLKSIRSIDNSCSNVSDSMGFSVKCSSTRKMTGNDEFSLTVNYLMGNWSRSPVLDRMADELVTVMKKSKAGTKAVHEIATLISIYEKGNVEREKMLKAAGNRATQKYKGISKNLKDYKRNLAKMSLKTMKNVNVALSNVEKILADSALKVSRQDLSGNVKPVKCLSVLLESILGNWLDQPEGLTNETFTDNFTIPNQLTRAAGRNEIVPAKNVHGEPLKKFIESMKHVGKTSLPGRSTALVSMANTFLLATLFYECIGLIAAVHHRPEPSPPPSQNPYSMENMYPDPWLARDGRTSIPIPYGNHQSEEMEDDNEYE